MQLSSTTLDRMGDILSRVEAGSSIPERLAELKELESELRAALDTDVARWIATIPGTAQEAASNLYAAGGKRLRPVLALLCGAAVSENATAGLAVAAAVELLHTGTLLHDDVVDEGEIRRGQPTARRVWGNALAVLSGDFCYFAALDALVDHGDHEILKRAMRVARALSEGELIQLQRRGKAAIDGEEEYFKIIECKTASLFAFATWGGARCAAPDSELLGAFDDYGRKLGLAFQIVDDVLDFAGDPAVFGKALGHDVAEGTVTLPLAYAMADDPALAADVDVLVSDFSAGRESAIDPTDIVERVCSSGGLDRARDQAKRLTSAAILSLEPIADSPYKNALELLAASLLERVS